MRYMKNELDWVMISKHQHLSQKFTE